MTVRTSSIKWGVPHLGYVAPPAERVSYAPEGIGALPKTNPMLQHVDSRRNARR